MLRGRPVWARKRSGPPVLANFGDIGGDASVLPDDGIVHRLAGLAIPHDGGLALVRNADGGQVRGVETALGQSLRDHGLGAAPDFLRVMLDPTGMRINLLMLLLGGGNDASGAVKDDETGAGGALIDGADVAGHAVVSEASCDA